MFNFRSFLQWCRQTGEQTGQYYDGAIHLCAFVGELVLALLDALRHPCKVKWRTVGYYLDICGARAMPIISLLGVLIGVILAFQALAQLGRYGASSYVTDLVGAVIVTELGPLMTAIVLAGRSGSAFAAELGSMKAGEEVDALVTMGLSTGRFLLTPKVVALMAALPGLTILADVCGILGGYLVVHSQLHISWMEYYSKIVNIVRVDDLIQGMLKSCCFGIIVAAVGCLKGFEAPRDAQGVGQAATSAIVMAIFLIIVIDAALTALFSI